jgi:nitrogen regulatory protein PII
VNRSHHFELEGIFTMKEIKAIGQPFFLLKVIERLRGVPGQLSVTVSEILDFGGLVPVRTSQADGDFVKKWKLEVIVPDSTCQSVIETIHDCAQSENGAGPECFVSEITEIVRGNQ